MARAADPATTTATDDDDKNEDNDNDDDYDDHGSAQKVRQEPGPQRHQSNPNHRHALVDQLCKSLAASHLVEVELPTPNCAANASVA